jgi:serine/threonine protein kinase
MQNNKHNKCLKPISERKIRRELLVLTHCVTLPNLARLIGIALPESMDQEDDNVDNIQSVTSQTEHPKKRRRKNHKLQQVDIGSITDAAASVESDKKKVHQQQQQPLNKYNEQLPALILEHAGTHSKWFCHDSQSKTDDHGDSQNKEPDYHLSERQMKYYLCHLLIALDALHSAGLMHRDVKPRNCLINFPTSQNKDLSDNDAATTNNSSTQQRMLPPQPLMLVDLGLADFYLPGKEYNVRVASRHYKSPELLIGFSYYDYAIDMWSVGCILAGLLFRREPFFRGKDNEDQLGKIVSVLGTRDFLPYVRKCNVRLTSGMRASIGKYCSVALSGEKNVTSSNVARRKPWLSYLTPECPIPSSESLDLLDKLLVYDHEQRWTAREALGHTFFDEVRDEVWREVRERMLWESQWRSRIMQWR